MIERVQEPSKKPKHHKKTALPAAAIELTPKPESPLYRRAVNALLAMRIGAKGNPELEQLVRDVEFSVAHYMQTVSQLEHIKIKRERGDEVAREDVAVKDQNRHNAHNSLISAINAASRRFAFYKLDNEWRNVIGSSHTETNAERQEILEWATYIGELFANESKA